MMASCHVCESIGCCPQTFALYLAWHCPALAFTGSWGVNQPTALPVCASLYFSASQAIDTLCNYQLISQILCFSFTLQSNV